MTRRMNLQLFTEGGDGNGDNGTGNGGAAAGAPAGQQAIDYEKLAQIIAGKQSATEDSVIRGYLKQQGLTKEDMDEAIKTIKAERAKNDPSKKLAELQAKLDQHDREKVLAKKNVRAEDYDYIIFKASQKVDDKTTFEKAVDDFLKDNPRFTQAAGGYRVDAGASNSGQKKTEGGNAAINELIRNRFKR